MLNHTEIVDRIEALRTKEGLSAAAFAQHIGVPRSSLSHLISGRNKPSLDLLVKIAAVFPEVSLDALVFGRPAPAPPQDIQPPVSTKEQKELNFIDPTLDTPPETIVEEIPSAATKIPLPTTAAAYPSAIRQIVLLHEDGHFEIYSSNS